MSCQHNSIQILDKNLDVVGKMLEMATREGKVLAEKLIENALEDCVSAFDGFGRELCRVHATKARIPAKAEKINFQNLEGARKGTVKLTNLSTYSAPSPLSKLLILHPSVDRFRLQNSRFLFNLTIPLEVVCRRRWAVEIDPAPAKSAALKLQFDVVVLRVRIDDADWFRDPQWE